VVEKEIRTVIILDQIVSVDGFAARLDGSCDFFLDLDGIVDTVGDPVRARAVDAALLGAVTYREFSAFWPTQDPQALVNWLPKHVVSNTLRAAPWGDLHPATVERGHGVDIARRVADQYAGDVIVWGSLTLARCLLQAGLVAELWLRIAPVTIGSGRTLTPDRDVRLLLAGSGAHPGGWGSARYKVLGDE
jgi:dihydrofolate reductase